MTVRAVYRILSPTVFIALVALCIAGCSREPAWQHRTLRGIDADVQRDKDVKWCEDQAPHELPTAVYVNTQGLYTYESQDGREGGDAKGKSSAARTGSLEAIRRRKDSGSVSPSKIEAGQRRGAFHQCMTRRGWTVKGRNDKAANPASNGTEKQPMQRTRPVQPGTPGSL